MDHPQVNIPEYTALKIFSWFSIMNNLHLP